MAAPAVLFVYDRPRHTARTLAALAGNALAAETPLIVFADGARGPADAQAVAETRALLQAVQGFASVAIVERERNFGLADSIAEGVTAVMAEQGRAIVLEDDIVVAPGFLSYMNAALARYENEERVMHLAGHLPPLDPAGLPESFFLRQSSCWGWASWARAWRHFHRRPEEHVQTFRPADIRRFNLDGTYDYWRQLLANADGRLKTWAVFWYACVFSRGGLCLHPRRSLVQNIGFDGSGENCGPRAAQETSVAQAEPPRRFPEELAEHREAMRRYQAHLRGGAASVGLAARLKAALARLRHG